MLDAALHERLRLESELRRLREQGERDAEALRVEGMLVGMMQEAHAALIASNEHLLREATELRAQFAAEVEAFRVNFEELEAELERQKSGGAAVSGATASGAVVSGVPVKRMAGGGGGLVSGLVQKRASARPGKEN